MEYGKAVRYYRNLQGVKQCDLAEQIGISPGHLNKIEHGIKIMTLPVAAAIAETLGVTLNDLADAQNALADTQEVQQ